MTSDSQGPNPVSEQPTEGVRSNELGAPGLRPPQIAAVLIVAVAISVPVILGIRGCFQTAENIAETVTKETNKTVVEVVDRFVPKTEVWNDLMASTDFGSSEVDQYAVAVIKGRETKRRTAQMSVLAKLVVQVSYDYKMTFFVPLNDKHWKVESYQASDGIVRLRAIAPALDSDVKVSGIQPETTNGSVFYDSQYATGELLKIIERDVAERAKVSARKSQTRDVARRTIRRFIRTWVVDRFPESETAKGISENEIEVYFADEPTSMLK